MNGMLQKRRMEDMMKEPVPYKRVSIVRLRMLREDRVLYGTEQVTGAKQAAEMIRPLLTMSDREIVVVMSLDAKLQPVAAEIAAVGGVNICQVDIGNIFKHAILSNAAFVICFHNHPSGDPGPSQEDYRVTESIRRAGELLGIPLVDHIIIAGDKFCSLKEQGRLGTSVADVTA